MLLERTSCRDSEKGLDPPQNEREEATREQLAALLWGNSSDKQARQSLRQTILLLRKDLQPADIVDAGTEVIRLQPGRVWVDALDFDALSASGDGTDLERAVGLVQGEFMAGFALAEEPFEDWLRQRRRHFETAGTGAFESFAQQRDRMGRGGQAIAAIERLLALDPLREDWQRLALRLYARHRGPPRPWRRRRPSRSCSSASSASSRSRRRRR